MAHAHRLIVDFGQVCHWKYLLQECYHEHLGGVDCVNKIF